MTLRESELSEHGFSLRNRVRKDESSGRVICSDRAKACHDRRLHIVKTAKRFVGTISAVRFILYKITRKQGDLLAPVGVE